MKEKLILTIALLIMPITTFAQGGYKQPAKEIMDVLNAPAIPSVSVSPVHDKMALLEPLRYPPISELAQPMLRIAGLRINPNTNGQHRQSHLHKVSQRELVRRRRANIFFMLVLVTGVTAFLAATTKANSMVYAFAFSFVSLCGYCYKLVQIRSLEVDREADTNWFNAA